MKNKFFKRITYIFIAPVLVPIVLLLQKNNQSINYNGSYSEIFRNYFLTVMILLLIYGIVFLVKYFREKS